MLKINDQSEKLTKDGFYPLADFHRENRNLPSLGYNSNRVMAKWDGKPARPVKAGEWFLSGAIIEAYHAQRDLTTPYHIAKLYRVTRKQITVTTPLEEVKS